MALLRWLRNRLGPASWTYVAGVAVLATVGFTTWDATLLTVVVLGTLPASILTIAASYAVLGLLGQVPGANPDHASGSGFAVLSTTEHLRVNAEQGVPAAWFLAVGPVVITTFLVSAAVLNALLVQASLTWWRRHQPAAGD
ncbi:MAG TPA: hypothetical protein VFL69_13015 [Marmoricola sp.]|nr:hypothetical protein [Marmoricola sp.]